MIQRWRPIAFSLLLGTLGGWLALQVSLPLPWMIGAMVANTFAAVIGAPVGASMRLRQAMVAVLGVMLGSSFTPEIFSRMIAWLPSVIALAGYTSASGFLGFLYLRRFSEYDRTTAYFSAMPGGLSEMILVGEASGGNAEVISLTHALRILLIVIALPFLFGLWFDYAPAERAPVPGEAVAEIPVVELGLLLASGIVGYLLASSIKLPASALVGPMLASAALHLAGITQAAPPVELVAAAQVIIGSAIGSRFAGIGGGFLLRIALISSGGAAILMVVTCAFALALAPLTGLELSALVLAFAPGGLAEMSLIALALGIEAAFVATHHILRIFLVVVLAPAAFHLWQRYQKEPGQGE